MNMWDNPAFADLLNCDESLTRVNFGMETFITALQNRGFWPVLYGSTEAEGL